MPLQQWVNLLVSLRESLKTNILETKSKLQTTQKMDMAIQYEWSLYVLMPQLSRPSDSGLKPSQSQWEKSDKDN